MSTVLKGLLGSGLTIISTELNSLASGSSAISTVVHSTGVFSNVAGDTDLGGYPEAYAELILGAAGGAYTANTGIDVYFLTSLDGTNYEDGSTSVTPARNPDLTFPLRNSSTATRVKVLCFPPVCANIKCLVVNNGTGQALASSGNSVVIYPLTQEAV